MHHRADRVQRELEFGDDTEVPASAADRPEQIGVVGVVGVEDSAVGRHHRGPDHVVAAEAGEFREPADATAERQTGNTGTTDESTGNGKSVLLGGGVEFAPGCAAAADNTLTGCVDSDRLHRREVDHQAAVRQGGAGIVVAATAYGYFQPGAPRMSQGSSNILGGAAPHNDGRTAPDRGVPDVDRIGVAVIPGHTYDGRRTDLQSRHRCLLGLSVPANLRPLRLTGKGSVLTCGDGPKSRLCHAGAPPRSTMWPRCSSRSRRMP